MDNTHPFPFLDLMLPIHQELASWMGLAPQFGLININRMATDKPELERRVIEKAGSYGRQLGRLIETLELVLDRCGISDGDGLSTDQEKTLKNFRKLATDVKAVKKGYTPLTEENIRGLVKGITHLRENDPVAFGELRQRLLNTLEASEPD